MKIILEDLGKDWPLKKPVEIDVEKEISFIYDFDFTGTGSNENEAIESLKRVIREYIKSCCSGFEAAPEDKELRRLFARK